MDLRTSPCGGGDRVSDRWGELAGDRPTLRKLKTAPHRPSAASPRGGGSLGAGAALRPRAFAAMVMERVRGVRASPGCVSFKYRFDEAGTPRAIVVPQAGARRPLPPFTPSPCRAPRFLAARRAWRRGPLGGREPSQASSRWMGLRPPSSFKPSGPAHAAPSAPLDRITAARFGPDPCALSLRRDSCDYAGVLSPSDPAPRESCKRLSSWNSFRRTPGMDEPPSPSGAQTKTAGPCGPAVIVFSPPAILRTAGIEERLD